MALTEGAIANGFYTVGNGNGKQVATMEERGVTNTGDAIGNGDGGKCIAPAKSAVLSNTNS